MSAAVVLISMGALLGRTTPIQLLVMALIEIVVYAGNEYFQLELLKVFSLFTGFGVSVHPTVCIMCASTALHQMLRYYYCCNNKHIHFANVYVTRGRVCLWKSAIDINQFVLIYCKMRLEFCSNQSLQWIQNGKSLREFVNIWFHALMSSTLENEHQSFLLSHLSDKPIAKNLGLSRIDTFNDIQMQFIVPYLLVWFWIFSMNKFPDNL